jgi:hypothetical protein
MNTFGKRDGKFCGAVQDPARNRLDALRTRLGYLRGTGMELALDSRKLQGMSSFARNSGLRRLLPVDGDVPVRGKHVTRNEVLLRCTQCGRTGLPHEMLANLDGEPFKSYEHERCPV